MARRSLRQAGIKATAQLPSATRDTADSVPRPMNGPSSAATWASSPRQSTAPTDPRHNHRRGDASRSRYRLSHENKITWCRLQIHATGMSVATSNCRLNSRTRLGTSMSRLGARRGSQAGKRAELPVLPRPRRRIEELAARSTCAPMWAALRRKSNANAQVHWWRTIVMWPALGSSSVKMMALYA